MSHLHPQYVDLTDSPHAFISSSGPLHASTSAPNSRGPANPLKTRPPLEQTDYESTSTSHGYTTRGSLKKFPTRQFLLPPVSRSASTTSLMSSSSGGSSARRLEVENEILRKKLEEALTRCQQAQQAFEAERLQRQIAEANHQASNAHCTLHALENDDLRTQLEKKTERPKRRNIHTSARLLTAPEAQAAFAAEEEERQRKEQAEEAKRLDKEAADRNREYERAQNAVSKIFDAPITSYKKKDDILDIASALKLSKEGTVPVLLRRIQAHMLAKPELANNPRFTGLFATSRRPRKRTVANDSQGAPGLVTDSDSYAVQPPSALPLIPSTSGSVLVPQHPPNHLHTPLSFSHDLPFPRHGFDPSIDPNLQ